MIRFSKKIEYALDALNFLGMNPTSSFSAREISERLNIPYEFLSKTMQQLAKKGIVRSISGVKGGYVLSISPENIKFADILGALEEDSYVVECFADGDDCCQRNEVCTIKTPMMVIQSKIDSIILSTTLADILSLTKANKDFNVFVGYKGE